MKLDQPATSGAPSTKNRLRPSPQQYKTYVAVAGISLAMIVFTGAAVRLTQAGLGCEDWPACNDQSLTPEWELHGWIEFGNRLISGVVAIATSLAVLTAYRRQPYRSDLVRWSWGLVAGTVAQIFLGGATVLLKLHPAVVGAHYLLSMILLWNVVVLWFKASAPGPAATPAVSPRQQNLGRLVLALATLVAVLGTVATGTGPNAGDPEAERLPFVFQSVVQNHSISVWVFLAATIVLAITLQTQPESAANTRAPTKVVRMLLAVSLLQGAIGYTQYFRGVPPLLVELHIVGAVSVWVLTVGLYLSMFNRN